MPTKPRKIPSYRLHNPTGQAVVRVDGRDYYLGRHGTEASHEAYCRKMAEWLARAPSPTAGRAGRVDVPDPSVNEVVLAFWDRFAERHYRRPDGSPFAAATEAGKLIKADKLVKGKDTRIDRLTEKHLPPQLHKLIEPTKGRGGGYQLTLPPNIHD